MAVSSADKNGGGRIVFGTLLSEALKRRRMRQDDLARALGTTQSSVSGWINGKYEPAADTVFAMEEVLGLEAGHLSRPLGYLPVEQGNGPMSVETAIAQSAVLDSEEKEALVALYRLLVNRHAVGSFSERDRAGKKPSTARPARLGAAGRPRRVSSSR